MLFCIFEKKRVLKNILETKGYTSIRLKKTKSQHLVAQLEVNAIEGLFLIDTGASNSCIRADKEVYFELIGKDKKLKQSFLKMDNTLFLYWTKKIKVENTVWQLEPLRLFWL